MQRLGSVIAIALTAAGCSHAQVQLNAGGANTVAGGGGSSAAALIGLGIAGAVIYHSEQNSPGGYGTRYDANPFMAVTGTVQAPELAPGRRVNEQDCTQPIADLSANLKCR
jgi:hypothetical protein